MLREENAALQEEIATLRALVSELLSLKTEVEHLRTQVKQLESRLAKDSHNSHLPLPSIASADKTNRLRKPIGKKPGVQIGHEGNALSQVEKPDQTIVHGVETCSVCQHNLSDVAAHATLHRQVLDIPAKRVIVVEHQAQQKVCPHC